MFFSLFQKERLLQSTVVVGYRPAQILCYHPILIVYSGDTNSYNEYFRYMAYVSPGYPPDDRMSNLYSPLPITRQRNVSAYHPVVVNKLCMFELNTMKLDWR